MEQKRIRPHSGARTTPGKSNAEFSIRHHLGFVHVPGIARAALGLGRGAFGRRLGTPSHTIQAQLTKTYDLADAALGLRGNAAAVNLAGGTIVISGADYDPVTAGPSAAKSRPAVSASSDALRDLFRQAVGSPSQVSLDSASASPAVTTSGFFPV